MFKKLTPARTIAIAFGLAAVIVIILGIQGPSGNSPAASSVTTTKVSSPSTTTVPRVTTTTSVDPPSTTVIAPTTTATTTTVSPFAWNDWHVGITTTYEQGGMPDGENDRGISNVPSAWYGDWTKHLCGPDEDGSRRVDLVGCDNMFYAAVPCPDYDSTGFLPNNAALGPWPMPAEGQSSFKDRWIEVRANGKSVFVQWEDVGPLGPEDADDCSYVFGGTPPAYLQSGHTFSGLDVSPLAFKLLTGLHTLDEIDELGTITADWRFVNAKDVPPGYWVVNPTHSPPDW